MAVKLFCAVVGVAGSVFLVNIDSGETVKRLKKVIKEKKMYQFPSALPANTKVKKEEKDEIDTEKGDAAMKLEEGTVGQDTQTWIIRKPMDPTWSIQGVLNEDHMPVPQSKQIHVLVELGYENEAVDVKEEGDNSINPYSWQADSAEDPEDQRNGYMQYLKDNLHGFLHQDGRPTISPGTSTSNQPKYHLKDTSQMTSMLNFKASSLPFGLKGTADLMIIGEVAHSMNDVFADLQFVINIKTANWKSYSRCAPIGLLTNLNDYWYFMWFTTDKKIARMKVSYPANGFKKMKDFLETGTIDNTSRGVYSMRIRSRSSPISEASKVDHCW
ncbi:hypothetical protein P3T76_014041 [Phytophthora citrophthora]|uniref:Crinkler effector protein N-terminal domain-containing protein n=1 Tax=Phytophthora citrophthora TaxID=4793 RepID=A0AAD9G2B4_9STRA|nr:hypothetical protein P3T76_014041 [Phytophthora citrophthora]